MSAFKDLPAAIFGSLGEVAGSDLMKSDGASMMALCRIDTGGAPMLERGAVRGRSVLPDYQAFNWKAHPGACFVEIKTYAEYRQNHIETRRAGYPVYIHGIPVRLFDHYLTIENETKLPVFLAVNELNTGKLRVASVTLSSLPKIACSCKGGCRSANAAKHTHVGGGIREMQWYFDRELLSIEYTHSDKTITKLRQAHDRLMRRGHALRRHVDNEPTPARSESLSLIGAACQACGKRTECMHRVGPLDENRDDYILCAPCWRSGEVVSQEAP
jgi:hypothetical protein